MMQRILFICWIIVLVNSPFAFSSEPTYFSFSTISKLPSNEIYDITSDEYDNIWISTDRGLAKYDGYSFEIYTTDDGLADNTNFYFIEGENNKKWLSGFNRRLTLMENDLFYHFVHNDNIVENLNDKIGSWIRYVIEVEDGIIVLPYKFRGSPKIYKILNTGELEILDTNSQFYNSIDSQPKLVKIKDDYYNFYVEYEDRFSSVSTIKKVIKDESNQYFLSDKQSIYKKDLNFNTLSRYSFPYSIEKHFIDRQDNLWVCTRGGLYFFKDKDLSNKPKLFFQNLLISTIFQDFQGDYWVGTNDDGIKVIPLVEIENIVTDKSVLCLTEFNDKIFFGTTKFEIGEIDKTSSFKINTYLSRRKNLQITKIEKWDEKKLIISGGYLFGGNSIELLGNSVFKESNIATLAKRLNNDDIFIISSVSSFAVYHYKEKKYVGYNRLADNPLKEIITCLIQDDKQRIWLGTRNGLYLIDSYDYMNCMPILKSDNTSLGRISSLQIDINKNLIVTTLGNGAYIVNDDNVAGIVERTKLSSLMINEALAANDSILWLATNNGIDVLKYTWNDTLSIEFLRNINNSDGLVSNYVNDIEYWNGYIWAATNNGISRFKPEIIDIEVPQIPIYITNFENQDSTYQLDQELEFAYNQNDVLITYSGLSYQQQNDPVEYKYRLVKNDQADQSKWYYTTDRNLRFNDLAHGNYLFEVTAINKVRVWNENPAKINFTIKPHFTQTAIFKIIVAALGLLFIYLIYRYQMNRVQIKQAQEAELLKAKQKAQEAELASIRNQMNPHFVYNSLNSIQNLIFKDDKEAANKYMSKFSRLMRQSLQFSSLNFITLKQEIQFLKNYIDLESLRFPNKFSANFEVGENLVAEDILIPSLILQPIIENSIKHGMNGITYPGIINVDFTLVDNQFLKINISDNGLGSLSHKTRSQNDDHQSMGINLVKSRIEILNNSEFKGNGKFEEMVTDKGYRTIITIPLV